MSKANGNDKTPEKTAPNYQRLIQVDGRSSCCDQPQILKKSSGGGFVLAYCSKCDKGEYLDLEEFKALPWFEACPNCGDKMTAGMISYSNYGFHCKACDRERLLADLIPCRTSR